MYVCTVLYSMYCSCTYVHTYICMCTYSWILIHAHMDVYVCIIMLTWMCMYVWLYIRMYTLCMHTYVYTYMNAYIHVYVHVHTHCMYMHIIGHISPFCYTTCVMLHHPLPTLSGGGGKARYSLLAEALHVCTTPIIILAGQQVVQKYKRDAGIVNKPQGHPPGRVVPLSFTFGAVMA